MFHVEVNQGTKVARAFNLSPERLEATVLKPWRLGEEFMLGDQHFVPADAEITVLEARELRQDELAMGRGWSGALKLGEDVTARVVAGGAADARSQPPPPAVVKFKQDVVSQCGAGRIGLHQVVWLAGDRYPESRVSDRLALAERAVWELLHERKVRMLDAAGEVEPSRWQPALLSWESWAGGRGPAIQIEAV